MSIQNAVANCKKPFAKGCKCQAYYSKQYDCVIKKPHDETNGIIEYTKKIENEKKLFEMLTDEEKQFFPIIDFVYSKQYDCDIILMKKIDDTIYNLTGIFSASWELANDNDLIERFNHMKNRFNLNFDSSFLVSIIRKYNLSDLHAENLGIYNNQIVIIDFDYNK